MPTTTHKLVLSNIEIRQIICALEEDIYKLDPKDSSQNWELNLDRKIIKKLKQVLKKEE